MGRRLLCLVLVTCALVQAPAPAVALDAPERTALFLLNRTRVRHDRRELLPAARLTRYAERHSKRMARRRTLFHSSLDISGYSALGEIVGAGGSVRKVHRAFLHSRDHRRIMLGRWKGVGIGVVKRRGVVYVTEIFAR